MRHSSASEITAAVGSVMAAIEVVDDRYSDWGSLGAIQLIADDFFGAGCVLGAEHELRQELDLAAVSARMTVNGLEVGAGVGADILGDPLTALMWLVNEMAGYGHSFRRGSFVLLGSLVQTHWVEQNDVVVVENVPLGQGDGTLRLKRGGLVRVARARLGGLLHDPIELVRDRYAGRDGPGGVDLVRPGRDDRLDDGVRRPADRPELSPSATRSETLHHLSNRRGPARKDRNGRSRAARRSPRAARSTLRPPSGTRERHACVLRDGDLVRTPRQRLAEDRARDGRGGGIRRARADDDRRQPGHPPIESAASGVVDDQKLEDRLRHPVGRLRRELRVVSAHVRQRRRRTPHRCWSPPPADTPRGDGPRRGRCGSRRRSRARRAPDRVPLRR